MALLQDRSTARRWYTAVSPFYDAFVAETFWPTRLQRQFLDRLGLSPADRVLDIGCGTGVTTRAVSERAASVVGVDHSQSQLTRATRKGLDAALVRADAESLPFPDDAFDAVVSVGTIIYLPDPVAALDEARRVTRPNGRILVAGFNRTHFPSWVPIENWATPVNEALFHTWNGAEAREQFATAGWDIVETDVTGPGWHPRLARVVTASNSV